MRRTRKLDETLFWLGAWHAGERVAEWPAWKRRAAEGTRVR